MGISISVYSLINSIIIFNLGLLIIVIVRRKTLYLQKYKVESLMFLLILSVIRLVVPIDYKYAFVINSSNVLPWIQRWLNTPVITGVTLGNILLAIWFIGAIFEFACTIFMLYKSIKTIKKYQSLECPQVIRLSKLSYYKNVSIVVSPDILFPMVIGIKHAYIFLPVLDVTDEELNMILKHEIQHVKGGDILIKCLFYVLGAIFWWNPLTKVFRTELENTLELRCDNAITRNMDSEKCRIYCYTLIKVARQALSKNAAYNALASGFYKANDVEIVKQRMEMVLHKNKKLVQSQKTILTLAIFIIFIASYLAIIQPHYSIPNEENQELIQITTENAHIEKKANDTYILIINGKEIHELSKEDIKLEPYKNLQCEYIYD